jgi:hypothetical protein
VHVILPRTQWEIVDNDIDLQIAALKWKKAERRHKEWEEEAWRLAEAKRQAGEIWAAMMQAAVEQMVVEKAEEAARMQVEEIVWSQGRGSEAEGARGQKRPRSDSCTHCRQHSLDCEWPESGQGKSCLACVAKKAKCSKAKARPPKKRAWTPESDDEFVNIEAQIDARIDVRMERIEEMMQSILEEVRVSGSGWRLSCTLKMWRWSSRSPD